SQILEEGEGEFTHKWSGIMHSILSGVMDYLDSADSAGDLVRGHTENQRDLRNKYAGGGKHIGAALARRRAQGDIQKRDQFLDSVFDPGLFPYHEAMKGIMAKLPKADWEEIERRLIDILAKTNIDFPQPFKIVQSSVDCNIASPVGRLYMEKKAITSNVEEASALLISK
ncbi:hypothetical protein MPER_10126, partial [Moniliophthora perniciosa FA553]